MRYVFRELLDSQGRQTRFEAAEVSELFSWFLHLPKDRERGRASNDELNPALFEVIGRNSQYQLQGLCVSRSYSRAKRLVFGWQVELESLGWLGLGGSCTGCTSYVGQAEVQSLHGPVPTGLIKAPC